MNGVRLKKYPMKAFILSIILSLVVFSILPAGGNSDGTQSLGQDVPGAFAQADDDISPQDAYFLGRAVAANILARYPLYTQKPAVTLYLNQICTAIAINSPMPDSYNGYHVAILDSPDLNAFATTGGHIFICRGFMELLTSEDALAAVLAHEIAHIQLKHGIEIIKERRLTQDFSDAAKWAADLSGQKKDFDNSVSEMVITLFENSYSREQELAADTYAIKLLADAGYSPSSLVDVLTLIQRPEGTDGFDEAYPQSALRVGNAQMELMFLPVQDSRSFRASRFAEAFR
jgi:predicted Zn-dependent protease